MIKAPAQTSLFAGDGAALRNEGMARVIGNYPTFSKDFLLYVANLPHGWEGQCEDIRAVWPGPWPKPQAWGACWNVVIRKGLLVDTGIEVQMKARRSHARKTHLFRRV